MGKRPSQQHCCQHVRLMHGEAESLALHAAYEGEAESLALHGAYEGEAESLALYASYFAISSNDFTASLKSAVSAFAAPGSPGRAANTSLPDWPKATFSSFFPSSNFTVMVSAGLSSPVFAVESTNELARMFDSFESRPSIFSLSTSAAAGLTRFHVSGLSFCPFTRSSTIVWPLRDISMCVALNGRNS